MGAAHQERYARAAREVEARIAATRYPRAEIGVYLWSDGSMTVVNRGALPLVAASAAPRNDAVPVVVFEHGGSALVWHEAPAAQIARAS